MDTRGLAGAVSTRWALSSLPGRSGLGKVGLIVNYLGSWSWTLFRSYLLSTWLVVDLPSGNAIP